MERNEMEEIIKKIQIKYHLEDCPKKTKERYWNAYKHYTPENFELGLDGQYARIESIGKSKEVVELKKQVADLILKLLTTDEGLFVLSEINQFFDLEIIVDQDLVDDAHKVAELLSKTPLGKPTTDDKEKCPDKLTPDILKILKGGKDG